MNETRMPAFLVLFNNERVKEIKEIKKEVKEIK